MKLQSFEGLKVRKSGLRTCEHEMFDGSRRSLIFACIIRFFNTRDSERPQKSMIEGFPTQ